MMTQHEHDLCEAACCLWEEVLQLLDRNHKQLDEIREAEGMSALRLKVVGWVDELEADYKKAVADGYDDSFDWEFVPAWINTKLSTL